MYAEMMRRMQQKDVEKKKIDDKKAIALLADSEVLLFILMTLSATKCLMLLVLYHVLEKCHGRA